MAESASREEMLAYLDVMSKHFEGGGTLEDLPRPENIEVLPEIIAQAARMAGLVLDYIKTGEPPDMTGTPSPESQLQVSADIDTFDALGPEILREQMTQRLQDDGLPPLPFVPVGECTCVDPFANCPIHG